MAKKSVKKAKKTKPLEFRVRRGASHRGPWKKKTTTDSATTTDQSEASAQSTSLTDKSEEASAQSTSLTDKSEEASAQSTSLTDKSEEASAQGTSPTDTTKQSKGKTQKANLEAMNEPAKAYAEETIASLRSDTIYIRAEYFNDAFAWGQGGCGGGRRRMPIGRHE